MTEIVASPFEEFISACDLKRKENKAAFDIKYEFKKLTQIEQTRILESIKSYKIKAATNEDRLSIQDEFYRPLKSIILDNASLKGDKQESVTFETSLIGDNGEKKIVDYEKNEQKIMKEGDKYFVYSQEVYREATISVPSEGYIALEFTTSFDLEQDFLRALEVNYYLKCSRDNSLSTSELARFGMIREFNPEHFKSHDLSAEFKLFRGAFTEKSSFLHLKINELSPLQLENFIQSIPEYLREAYFKLKDAKGKTVLDIAGTEQAHIIRAYLNQEIPSLENEPQNVHVAPVHNFA